MLLQQQQQQQQQQIEIENENKQKIVQPLIAFDCSPNSNFFKQLGEIFLYDFFLTAKNKPYYLVSETRSNHFSIGLDQQSSSKLSSLDAQTTNTPTPTMKLYYKPFFLFPSTQSPYFATSNLIAYRPKTNKRTKRLLQKQIDRTPNDYFSTFSTHLCQPLSELLASQALTSTAQHPTPIIDRIRAGIEQASLTQLHQETLIHFIEDEMESIELDFWKYFGKFC